MATIHELLPEAMKAIGAIGKAHENTQQRYKFRSVEDALTYCGPVLARLGISLAPRVLEHKVEHWLVEKSGKDPQRHFHCTLRMELKFSAADGSSVEMVLAGEGLDYAGDKSTNKALSAAFKYALFLGLCIPVDKRAIEDSDRPNKRKESSQPGAEADPVALAISAIRNAYTEADLARYGREIDRRAQSGNYTVEQVKKLEAAVEKRRAEIRGKAPVESLAT